ncbi:MAG: hypothetical protein VB949_13930 [Pseudomonadales bacterium]
MDNDSAKPDAQPFRLRLKDWGVATTGMVIGAVIGLAVEFGIESTGVMGPKIDALLEAQAGNFEQIKTKLDELSVTASTPEAQQLLGDLAELVSQQDELTREASSQLQLLEQERISFKKQQLTASGIVTSIDFWLQTGESINVASEQQALGATRIFANAVTVNVTGEKKNMAVGDAVDIAGDEQACRVILRKIERESQRAGFDIDCS